MYAVRISGYSGGSNKQYKISIRDCALFTRYLHTVYTSVVWGLLYASVYPR